MFRTFHLFAIAGLAAISMATAGSVQADVVHTFTSAASTGANISNNTTCTTGTCSTYPIGSRIIITFTTASNLPANQVLLDISNSVISYSLSDGIGSITNTDPQRALYDFRVTTNSAGAITAGEVDVERWQGARIVTGRLDDIFVSGSAGTAYRNIPCTALGSGPAAASPSDTCFSVGSDTNTSRLTALSGGWTSVALAPVPTLSEWAMILFGLILASGAALYIQRRQLIA